MDLVFWQYKTAHIRSGSHFTASFMKTLTKNGHVRHHCTTAYSPLASGTVERHFKEFTRSVKAILPEWKLPLLEFPSVIEAAQAITNQSPLKRLGEQSPIRSSNDFRRSREVFNGIKASPLPIMPCP